MYCKVPVRTGIIKGSSAESKKNVSTDFVNILFEINERIIIHTNI